MTPHTTGIGATFSSGPGVVALINIFAGHTDDITSLVFSSPSSLISSSKDYSVKLWEISTLQTDPLVADPESTSLASAQIIFITLQAEEGIAISIDSNMVVKTWDISTGLCKASFQIPDDNYLQGDVWLVNGRLIFVWYLDKIDIWDVEKEKLLWTVDATLDRYTQDFRISVDGSKVFCLYQTSIQAQSIQTGKAVGKVQLGLYRSKRSLTVDGSGVWVHSPLSEPLGWDFGTPGSHPVQLSNLPLLLSNNAKLWDIKQSRINDAVTGRVIFQLAG